MLNLDFELHAKQVLKQIGKLDLIIEAEDYREGQTFEDKMKILQIIQLNAIGHNLQIIAGEKTSTIKTFRAIEGLLRRCL